MNSIRHTKTVTIIALCCAAAACGAQATTGISMHVPQPSANALTAQNGNNSLVLTSAELVLRKIELERDGGASCDPNGTSSAGDHDCPELKEGPFVVTLPLDGNIVTSFAAEIPAGNYKSLQLQMHKLSGAADQNVLIGRPDLQGSSVKVVGTYNGTAFTLFSDVTATQEIAFNPSVVVAAGKPFNITLSIDVVSWFKDAAGNFVDPTTSSHSGNGENTFKKAIQASFRGFEDNDHNGSDDHGH
jgi:hypothetical protein